MFVETVTVARAPAREFTDRTRLLSDPPPGLAAYVAWESGDDEVTVVVVWETPAARGGFAVDRVMPLFEDGTLGDEHGHPQRLTPFEVYVRP